MGADYKVGSLGKKKLSIQERICAYISYTESAKPAQSESLQGESACCDRKSRTTMTHTDYHIPVYKTIQSED